jgi:hypothetical protein
VEQQSDVDMILIRKWMPDWDTNSKAHLFYLLNKHDYIIEHDREKEEWIFLDLGFEDSHRYPTLDQAMFKGLTKALRLLEEYNEDMRKDDKLLTESV